MELHKTDPSIRKKHWGKDSLTRVSKSSKLVFMTHMEEKNEKNDSNLVYKFKCNIYNDIYYGKTKCHFKVRACKHLGITPLTGKKVKSPKESAAFDHIFHTGHNASFDDFETLVKQSGEFKFLLRESLLILCDDPPLNRYVMSIPLEIFS